MPFTVIKHHCYQGLTVDQSISWLIIYPLLHKRKERSDATMTTDEPHYVILSEFMVACQKLVLL